MGVQIIGERPFLIMEPVLPNQDGRQSLKDYLDVRLSLEQILNWSIQFCYGMEFIRDQGIKAHGDIKPENLLIDYRNQLKVSDFGLLELFDSVSEDIIKGTFPYMAPETFNGNYNVQTDIYAFGIVLYQLLNNGKLPFNAKNNFLEEWQELHETKSIPSTEPPEFNNIIQKCLNKNPQNRYSSFKELRSHLETIFSKFSDNEIYVPESKEISDAKKEGVEFLFLNNIVKILGTNKVEKIECIKTELVQKEGETRKSPVNIENSNYILNMDYVVMAVGGEVDKDLIEKCNISTTTKKYVQVNENNQTSDEKVFAGGDVVGQNSTVAWAASDGKNVASKIIKFLEEK